MSSPCHKCGVVTDFNGRWECNCDPVLAKKDRERIDNETYVQYTQPKHRYAAKILRELAKEGQPVTVAQLLRLAEKLDPEP